MNKNTDSLYYEKVSSQKTEALFVMLMAAFLLLFIWRINSSGWNGLAVVFFFLSVFFLFYSVNYRTLIIRITPETLKLSFGIFTWTVPFDNVESCDLDELPVLMKYGGAGIHYMLIRKRYRASFNFLEHPRVVIVFKQKVGPVMDISFSTRQPEEILRIIQDSIIRS